MARPRIQSCIVALALLSAALGGCSTRTNVSATGNTPPLYTHVYVTAQAVWFNGSATAGPDDGGWKQFALSTPVTVDLVADSGGNFANLVTDLRLAPGSYSQVRFIPVDASVPLTASAQTLGAQYNMEVDYVDSGGVEHQLPLELLNPDKGLGVQAALTVPIGSVGAAAIVGGAAGSGTTATQTPFSTFGTTTNSTTAGTTVTPTTSTGLPTTTSEFALQFDAARDITAFTYGAVNGAGGVNGALLSSHITASDLSKSGGIQGQLTLTNLTLTSANGTPGLEVTAESLSADGSRHIVVASSPVSSSGNFTLYPLAADSSNNTSYDIVIHGAGIATIIIKDVIIPPTGKGGVSTANLTGGGTGVTSTSTTGSTNPDTTTITPANLVSVGTLVPRADSSSYTANINNAGAPLPAGTEVGFYQTLPGAGEVPYLIEAAPIDPFNQVLGNAQALSGQTVDSGTYVSSAATVTLVSAAPQETIGVYKVAASAPSYADGGFAVTVSAPTTTGVTAAGPVTLQPLSLASGVTAASLSATITPASAGKYDQGEIMLSVNGQLVASAAIDTAISGGGTVQLSGIPGGTSSSLYYVTVRAWSSGNPTGVLTRQWYPAAVDLRSASSASVDLTVN